MPPHLPSSTFVALAILLVLGAVMVATIARAGLTNDEVVHIPAGYIALTTGDFRPNNEQPPLSKLLSALPLLPLRLVVPPPSTAPWEGPDARSTARALAFWEANRAQFGAIRFWARVPAIGLTLLLGWAIFAWGRQLFGAATGLLALALYGLDPTVLAHGRVVHTDLPAALGFFLGAWATVYYLRAPSATRAAILGGAVGLALLTKFSLLVFAPLPPLIILGVGLRGGRRRDWPVLAGRAALVALVALLVVNLAYGFSRAPLGPDDRAWIDSTPPSLPRDLLLGPSPVTALLPTDFVYGLYFQFLHDRDGHPAALLGQVSSDGWWYYYPVAFALKTTLPVLGLTLVGLAWAFWRLARRDWRYAAVLVPLAFFVALALNSRINIGIRHFLPVYPFCCLLGGALLARLLDLRPASPFYWPARVAVVAVTGWAMMTTALIFPHFLPYLNPLAAGRPGWQLLGDSNLEWGDDIPALAAYLRAQGVTEITAATSAGWATLPLEGIAYRPLLGAIDETTIQTRYVAVGAGFLTGATVPPDGREHFLALYGNRVPEAIFGGTIYLYRAPDLPAPLTAPLPARSLRATLTALDVPLTIVSGERAIVRVRVRNDGDRTLPVAPPSGGQYVIHIGNRWFDARDKRLILDDARAALPYPLLPGEEATVTLTVVAPQAGLYDLDVDLVQEGVAWSGAHGGTPARIRVRVLP